MRSYSVELILVAMLVAAVGFFGYLGYGLIRADAAVEGYSGESALAYAARQMEFGPRPITSDANAELETWLIGELQAADWRAAVQPYVAQVPVSAVGSDVLSATVSADFYTVEAENIIAVKSPTDVEDPPVGLLVTHFDSRVVSDADPDPALRADLNPGANAGASGTAALLELARTLDVDSTGHRLCLVFVNGEANRGLDGWETSHGIDYFLIGLRNGQVEQCANPRFAVVLDLVGGANQQIFVERTSDVGLSTELWGTARSLGYEDSIVPEVKWLARGPHAALNRAGIPSAVMLDYDYAYRDTTQDTVDKLDAESFARVGRVLANWLERGAPLDAE